jgi:hypothetical protein
VLVAVFVAAAVDVFVTVALVSVIPALLLRLGMVLMGVSATVAPSVADGSLEAMSVPVGVIGLGV